MQIIKNNDFSPLWMLFIVLSPLIFSYANYSIAAALDLSKMTYYQYLQITSLLYVAVVGGYQLYFWTQRNSNFFKTRILKISIDDWFPFLPGWVWVYSFLYYILIGSMIIVIPSIEKGVYFIFGVLVLLIIQCIFFILMPVTNPPEWRRYNANTPSKKYLKFIQSIDKENNCFPSMHVSLATYISMILFPLLSWYCLIFAGLIALSCLFTKQHMIVDVIAGFILGVAVYWIINGPFI